MKRLIFIALAVFMLMAFTTSCASGGSFSVENKIGVQVSVGEDLTAFCVFDEIVESKDLNGDITCSFTAKVENRIYQCDKIKLSKLDKDFKLETDCKVILDLSKEKNEEIVPEVINTETPDNTAENPVTDAEVDKGTVLKDFKNSGEAGTAQNSYALNLLTGNRSKNAVKQHFRL